MTTPPERAQRSLEWCEIRRWRGYRTSTFYAVTQTGDVLAESASFRWSKAQPPPETPDVRAAYDAVVAAVAAAGWTASEEETTAWCAARFSRPASAAPAPLEAPPLAAPRDPAPPAAAPPMAEAPQPIPRPAPPAPPPRPEAPPARSREQTHVAVASRPGRRRRTFAFAAGAAVLVAAGAPALPSTLRGTPPRSPSSAPSPSVPAHVVSAPSRRPLAQTRVAGPAKQAAVVVHRRALVDLRITAVDRPSWIEIRRRSANGPTLYRATLAAGAELHLRGARLWARFGAAGNLSIIANGRRVELSGTQSKVFVP